MQLAPEPLLSFDSDKIRTSKAKPVLSEYLFPQTSSCRLETTDETSIPRHIDNNGGLIPPRTWLSNNILDDLETWARLFYPSEVEVDFAKPEHSLDRMPTKVRVDLNGSGQKTICFFKAFGPGITGGPLNKELNVYKNIVMLHLGENVFVGRPVGIAHEHKNESTSGLLLRYIDQRGTLCDVVEDNPDSKLWKKWAAQTGKAVRELHKIGSIWGDAKSENILIDKDDKARITDSEGVYTHGWVDPDRAGTVEGDLQGLQQINRFIFEGPQDSNLGPVGRSQFMMRITTLWQNSDVMNIVG